MFLTISSCGMGNGYEAVMETCSFGYYSMNKINSFAPIVLVFLRKKISIYSMISAMTSNNSSKKNPQWNLGPTGDFLTPHYHKALCASFCAKKSFAVVLVADLALQMG